MDFDGTGALLSTAARNHPLAVDQREGIDEDRLKKMVIGLLHAELCCNQQSNQARNEHSR